MSLVTRKIDSFRDEILYELQLAKLTNDAPKDILIVVHNELTYVKNCIETIQQHTSNYTLYVWDNASDVETKEYLQGLDAHIVTSEENIGFIVPNNKLAQIGNSPYIILLNSDTLILHDDWAKTMIAFLENHDCSLVGYMGSTIDENGMGNEIVYGWNVDFVCGWGMCLPRTIYDEFGLFDEENLKFAYCEDSDFSFRLREAGKRIYALHLDYVMHAGSKTAAKIQDKCLPLQNGFTANHQYIRDRWPKYIKK